MLKIHKIILCLTPKIVKKIEILLKRISHKIMKFNLHTVLMFKLNECLKLEY